ncbi:glucokinase [Alphaproteobacteria bacterium]|nr:glucokinase [Alphaproteobacteria bacterium]
MKLLVADIGGTNARFAYKDDVSNELSNFSYLKCTDFENIFDAIKYYQEENNLDIKNMSIAVASTTKHDAIKFTNNHWNFQQSKVFEHFKLDKLIFINDFVAQSLCFGSFYKDLTIDPLINKKTALNNNLYIVRSGIPIITAPLLVTGPGTGLGVCTLLNLNSSSIAIEGEGGHSSFAPNSDIEVELLQFLRKKYDHVSNERIVSGSGIEEIFNFMLSRQGKQSSEMNAPEIGEKALLGELDALNSVKLMFSILGTIVSSVILINGAQGGVILSGGITPKLYKIFQESNFEKNLLNKGRRYNYIKDVPIWLTKDNNNGLKGALNAIDNPHYKDKLITK